MKTTYKIDPAHSNAQFVVRHIMITNVRGAFSGVEGVIEHDPENPGESSIGASASRKINRSDFGLKHNAALETGGVLVGDDLKIELEISAIRS